MNLSKRSRRAAVAGVVLLLVCLVPLATLTVAAPEAQSGPEFITVDLRGLSPQSASAPPTFTGEVSNDFSLADPSVKKVDDPAGIDVGVPLQVANSYFPSGWDIQDIRFYYDAATDVLYVGFNYPNARIEGPAGPVICGDADSDGDPGGTSPELGQVGVQGTDRANLEGSESVCLVIDTDLDGVGEAVAGVSGELEDINDFKVATYNSSGSSPMSDPWKRFGTAIAGAVHTAPTNPSPSWPDFEFAIANFSTMPGLPANWSQIGFLAFSGSQEDDGIGEDYFEADLQMTPTPTPTEPFTTPESTPHIQIGGSTLPKSRTELLGPSIALAGLAALVLLGALHLLRRGESRSS